MLVFKARRRRDPTISPFLTPSQKRVMGYFRDAMNTVRDDVISNEGKLLDAIMHRPLDDIVDMIPMDPWLDTQEKLADELLGDLVDGGHRYSRQVPTMQKATVTFRFDDTRPEGSIWARNRAGGLITEVTQGQRQVVRQFVGDSLMAGDPPRTIARNLRNTIGLTTQQAGWVRNFDDRLVSQFVNEGLTVAQAQARAAPQTARYHSRIHRYRTETIARTEILSASHEGRRQAWGQGLQEGFISPTAAQEWSAEVDNRVCSICESYDQTRVPIGQQFPDGDPPIHPMCRCDVLLIDDLPDRVNVEGDELPGLVEEYDMMPQARPGMGDGITVNDAEYTEMSVYSGRQFLQGRTAEGVPIFNAERRALHDQIIEDILGALPRSENPTLAMSGGGPASGKGTIVKMIEERLEGKSATIDPDNIKGRLPEYVRMRDSGDEFAAAFAHEESSYLAKRVLQAGAERRVDMVYDGTGDGGPASLLGKIETARQNGYRVTGHYVTIDTAEAIRRATARAERTGRKVPTKTITTTHAKVSRIWETAKDGFDEIELYDNNVDMRLIAQGGRGRVEVLDQQAFDSFLAKAGGG